MRLASAAVLLALSTSLASAATLNINLSADLYKGGANFEVLADDVVVGKGSVESSEGQTFAFEVYDNVSEISVHFTNDTAGPKDEAGNRPPGTDRNLVVISGSIGEKDFTGVDFVGERTFARDQKLVLMNNTTVTLAIAAPVVEARAAEQEPEIIAEPASQTETFNAPAQSGCDLSITITGYSSGMVSLSADQQALLAPALAVTNCSVSVIGYSSTSGSATTNEQIALDRASAVLEYLVQHGGVFTKQEAASAGETSEFGPEQRNNRRVVVQLQ